MFTHHTFLVEKKLLKIEVPKITPLITNASKILKNCCNNEIDGHIFVSKKIQQDCPIAV